MDRARQVESVQASATAGEVQCTLLSTDLSGSAAFYANFFIAYDLEKSPSSEIRLSYDPGQPPSKVTVICSVPGAPSITDHLDDLWRTTFNLFHAEDLSGGQYLAKGWTLTGRNHPYATKTYAQVQIVPSAVFRETTTLKLDHMPE